MEVTVQAKEQWSKGESESKKKKEKVMSTSPTIPASSAAATTTAATPTSAASGQNLNVDRWRQILFNRNGWDPAVNDDFDDPAFREKIYAWIIELSSPETREAALLELSKKREV